MHVFVCALRPYPANPASCVRCGCSCLSSGCGCAPPVLAGVVEAVCFCARYAYTPPTLAPVCGVGVCAWVWVSAAPRHSWVGCWGVCVCVRAPLIARKSMLGFVVRVSGFAIWMSPRQSRLGCWSVCVCVRAPPVPYQSWLGRAQ